MAEIRNNIVSLRLTKEEIETLRELAYQARLSVSAFIRKKVFEQENKEDVREHSR